MRAIVGVAVVPVVAVIVAVVVTASSSAFADAPRDFVANVPLVVAQGARAVAMGANDATLGNSTLISDRAGSTSLFFGHHGVRGALFGADGGNVASASVVTPKLLAPQWVL